MKTLNFEISKRLDELWVLYNIITKYKLQQLPNKKNNWWLSPKIVKNWNWKWRIFKTLTVEEAIEFISNIIINNISDINININNWYTINWSKNTYDNFYWKTLLEAIEGMIYFLLDNNLLWKQENN